LAPDNSIEKAPVQERPGSTEADQKQFGTLYQHLASIDTAFKTLAETGAHTKDPLVFRKACEEILRMHEAERLEAERNIKRYEAAITTERARQRSATLHSSLIVGVLMNFVGKAARGDEIVPTTLPDNVAITPAPEGADAKQSAAVVEPTHQARMTEAEARSKYCICGCVDKDDAKSCNCECHTGVPCSDKRCIVCTKWNKTTTADFGGVILVNPTKAVPGKKPGKRAAKKAGA